MVLKFNLNILYHFGRCIPRFILLKRANFCHEMTDPTRNVMETLEHITSCKEKKIYKKLKYKLIKNNFPVYYRINRG